MKYIVYLRHKGSETPIITPRLSIEILSPHIENFVALSFGWTYFVVDVSWAGLVIAFGDIAV